MDDLRRPRPVAVPRNYLEVRKIARYTVNMLGRRIRTIGARIATSHENWLTEEEVKALGEKYEPAIVKKVGEMAKQVGGHGGMDFLMDWRTIDCLRNGLPMDMDVYDAALWSSIAPLSEASVANRSNSVDVPDFTTGAWKTNRPIDTSLEKGGTTRVLM